MSLIRVVVKELSMRRTGAMLAGCAVALVTGGLVAASGSLRSFEKKEDAVLREKELQTSNAAARFENEYRSITTNMGFTFRVLPPGQNETNFFSDGFCRRTMPQKGPTVQAVSKTPGVEFVVPVLRQKVWWPEQRRWVVLCGTASASDSNGNRVRRSLNVPAFSGATIAGFEIGGDLHLARGGEIQMLGRKLRIDTLADQRGSIDDITLWLQLSDAQRILSSPGTINELWIWTLPSAQSKDFARQLINAVAPATVVEITPRVVVRQRSMLAAAVAAAASVQRERALALSASLRRHKMARKTAAIGIIAAVVWVSLLSFVNVFARRREIGVLRAMGFETIGIVFLCACRSAAIGVTGAIAGCLAGSAFSAAFAQSLPAFGDAVGLVVLTGCLSACAGIFPALLVSQSDPAAMVAK
jgi:hypothetical protein